MSNFGLFSLINFSWLPILPLLVVTLAAIGVLLIGVRVDDQESEGLGWLALSALGVAAVASLALLKRPRELTFAGALVSDEFTAYFYLAVLLAASVTVLMSIEYAGEAGLPGAEYYSLLLFATLGMMLMAAAGDLIVIFIGLETMSMAVYVLAGLARLSLKSNEAALKYFLLGAFSTGFLLYGIALIYGATATIKLDALKSALAAPVGGGVLLLAGLGMLLIGFGFKVAAVPFHMWTPDVYEGAPTSVTALMAVGVKLAAFAGFLRVFLVALAALRADWVWVLWVVAAATMTVGNVVAVVQSNIKRLLAYSAIAHAGYIIVAMTAADAAAGAAILYYLLGYAFTNLGAFAVVIALGRRGEPHDLVRDYRGLSARRPALAAAMALFMLSLTGVPPLAGFVGKFYVFSAALGAGHTYLVIIAVINSVISAYYYISVIVAMYMEEGGAEVAALAARPALAAAIAIAALGTVLVGIYPQPYMNAARDAFNSALGTGRVQPSAALAR